MGNESLDSSILSKISGKRGLELSSGVWKYFGLKSFEGAIYSFCNLCPYKSKGKVTTNCQNHLKSKHKDAHEKLVKEQENKKDREKKQKSICIREHRKLDDFVKRVEIDELKVLPYERGSNK